MKTRNVVSSTASHRTLGNYPTHYRAEKSGAECEANLSDNLTFSSAYYRHSPRACFERLAHKGWIVILDGDAELLICLEIQKSICVSKAELESGERN